MMLPTQEGRRPSQREATMGDPWRSPRVGANQAGMNWDMGSMLPEGGVTEPDQSASSFQF